MPKSILAFVAIFLVSVICFGQTSAALNTATTTPPNLATTMYQAATILSPHLYNGNRYHIYDSRSLDHQFFQTEEWAKGVIEYDGQRFEEVPMLYDIFKDQVVIQYKGHPGLIQLQSERVRAFSYIDHHFIRIESDRTAGVNLSTGFYDILYDGKTQVLARRTKLRQEQIEGDKVKVSFSSKDVFYIKKEGKYYSANTKNGVLSVFEDQKKALKKYLREQRLNYRKNTEVALVKLATYYDQIVRL
ncbi:MAG: hypothetical protein R2822_00490 [Spirosomataceae bacterium]